MSPNPAAADQARAEVPVLAEELRLAQQSYETAYGRLIAARTGSPESGAWANHTRRWRARCALLATRLNRARAEAEGRAWLRAL